MKSNFNYTLRNISKNKTNTIITAVGLSVAIACCLLIYFFVSQELSMNNFHTKFDRIYRLNYKVNYIFGEMADNRLDPKLVKKIKEEVPQVEYCTEYRYAWDQTAKFNNKYYELEMSYGERDFFEIFSFDFLIGDKLKIFENPNEIILTKDFAESILKDGGNLNDLIGESIEFPLSYREKQFTITGIINNIPKNSTINFNGMIPGENGQNFGGCDNNFGYTSIFYLLKQNINKNDADKAILAVLDNYYEGLVTRMINDNQIKKADNNFDPYSEAFKPYIIPLKEAYFSDLEFNCFEDTGQKRNSIILLAIGTLILIIACSNYVILSLGQYLKKVGDVGIRRSMGATAGHIFKVFFSEGVMLTLASFIIGIALSLLLIPIFGNLAQVEIHKQLINYPKLILFISIAFFTIVTITSIIPVLVFSKVKPNQMGNNKINIGKKSYLSQVFVSLQYSISIILIIVTIFVVQQSNYLKNRSLGVNTQNIIDISTSNIDQSKRRIFSKLLKENPAVLSNALVSRNFINGSSDSFIDKGNGEQIVVFRLKVDEDYIKTLKLELVAGEDFTEKNITPGDRSIIVNEEFVRQFEIEENPIGMSYNIMGGRYRIIGVVKDYNYRDATAKVSPAMHFTTVNRGNGYYHSLLRFQPNKLDEVVKHIKKCYEEVAPGKSLTYHFWDEQLASRYQEEERWSKTIGYAALIAILISTLGLFGLTILLVNQRIKEIGVRKVNGARAFEVLLDINKSFIIWLFGSLIVAAPLSFFIVKQWLASFPYRVEISWWVFILAGIISFGIAMLTVSYQSFMATQRNPVEALRYE